MFARFVFITVTVFSVNSPSSDHGSIYIFYLEADSVSLHMFLDILYSGLDNEIKLEVKTLDRLGKRKLLYGVSLADNTNFGKNYIDNNVLSHVIANMLPQGEALWLKLTRNSHRVLVADARKRTIDVADVSKFNTQCENGGVYLSAAVLLHELYEQFYLQHIARTEPGEATEFQLVQAHAHANQREGNYYHCNLQKEISKVYPGFILIRFRSLTDDSSIIYRAYYRRGNIYRVESEYL